MKHDEVGEAAFGRRSGLFPYLKGKLKGDIPAALSVFCPSSGLLSLQREMVSVKFEGGASGVAFKEQLFHACPVPVFFLYSAAS